MNYELIADITQIIYKAYPDGKVDTAREINPGRYCFYVRLGDGSRQILKVTDNCADNNSVKVILDTIYTYCLREMRENPKKAVVLKEDLSRDVVIL